uniref:Uncharacterized protein n=1 Tax=Melopsittacus undulatus TaxID=13146 RepID=A0A8V5FU57_MELUD
MQLLDCEKSWTWSTQSPSSEFSLGVLVLLAFLMVLLALVTILGHALVILAFIMDRNLRHRSNYYFLNLAISDFAVGKSQQRRQVLLLSWESLEMRSGSSFLGWVVSSKRPVSQVCVWGESKEWWKLDCVLTAYCVSQYVRIRNAFFFI